MKMKCVEAAAASWKWEKGSGGKLSRPKIRFPSLSPSTPQLW